MTGDQRLAAIFVALKSVGVSCLVMGGHAVRFYGLARHTDDYDLHVSAESWADLAPRLESCGLFLPGSVAEGPTWRAAAFRRFRIGTLATGGDEWLEFWRANHLLAPHSELLTRSKSGPYGGRDVSFLGLADLIRSKETERGRDWDDVTRLEEFYDLRCHAEMARGALSTTAAFSMLRSRAGFDTHFCEGNFSDRSGVVAALATVTNPTTLSYLIPFAPDAPFGLAATPPIEPVILDRLRITPGGSAMHLILTEIVRRRYVAYRQGQDRAEKQVTLAARS